MYCPGIIYQYSKNMDCVEKFYQYVLYWKKVKNQVPAFIVPFQLCSQKCLYFLYPGLHRQKKYTQRFKIKTRYNQRLCKSLVQQLFHFIQRVTTFGVQRGRKLLWGFKQDSYGQRTTLALICLLNHPSKGAYYYSSRKNQKKRDLSEEE